MAFADIALGQIKALRQPASPRHYEFWYNYATGYNPSLNQAINETLAQRGTITEADLEQAYINHLSPSRLTDKIDTVNSQVMNEIVQVMTMVDAAVGSANDYSASLASVTTRLGQSRDRDGLRTIVESLVQTAQSMKENNQHLEARLTASKQEITRLQDKLETVRNESLTDPLSTLWNRKYFDDAIARMLTDAERAGEPLALLMSDIDHFKSFNDTWGHLTGDQVLRLVATSVKQNVKGRDVAARYGGEEFAVILPNTILRSAITVADHIRRAVMSKELMKRSTNQTLGRVTISVGVAIMRQGDTPQSIISRADACLYAAKHGGRNRVISETDPEFTAMSYEPKVA